MYRRWFLALIVLIPVLMGAGAPGQTANPPDGPQYTADGRMLFPANYREWVYLSSGLGMSYTAGAQNMLMFDNVFVNPEAYRKFLETGTWPDKTMLVLEVRGAGSNASINKAGHFQTADRMGVEVHVKDEARFSGKWAFFGFEEGASPAKQVPVEASCYSCHREHGAVDTTFVQFYPTLLSIAKEKKTLSAAYLKESAAK
ncbi:MAG TPA: cytochrome P460 family protein [Terriglobales bacterium]|nr:cytochrome P460 family protein [Terriglobales bacterium]